MTPPAYTTTDPYLACFLVCEGGQLTGLLRTGPKKVLYSFAPSRELHVLLRLYWGGQPLPVVPSKLFATHFELKCRSICR